jgi:hypothetical protein
MTDAVTVTVRAMVDRSERLAVSQAAALLEGSLSAAADGPVTVKCEFADTFETLNPSGEACVVIASLLPEVANYQQPWAGVADRLSNAFRTLASVEQAPVFLCTVFRHVRGSAADPQSRLVRIRRLNLLAAELSRETGLFVVDLDRCLADIGGAKIEADYRLDSDNATKVVGREMALAIVSAGLDAYVAFEVQDAAKSTLSQTELGLAASKATEALPSNVLALGSGRRKQVVATVVDTDEESHVGWLFHLLLTGRLSPKEAVAKLFQSIASRGLKASSAMVFGAIWQRISGRPRMGR